MPRKRKPHDQAVPIGASEGYIKKITDYVSTKKFSKLFREKILSRYTVDQAHLIAHYLDTFALSREEGKAVPMPFNVLFRKLRSLYYKPVVEGEPAPEGSLHELLEHGILERDYFSQQDHKCYYYTAGPTLLAWLEADRRDKYIESLIIEPIVRLWDGKIAPANTHILKDAFGKPIPAVSKQALDSIKTNVINYKELDWSIMRLGLETERGDYRQRQKKLLRLQGIKTNLINILRQPRWTNKHYMLEYRPAYKGSRFGRLFEIGGAMQAMPKELKHVAYDYMGDVYNYDLRSCHLAIIAQLCREEGEPLTVLEEYIHNKDAKNHYANLANMDVRLWKACIIGLFYGAVLSKSKQCSLYRQIWEAYEETGLPYDEADVSRTYDNFFNVALPLIQAREKWLKVLKDKIVPRLTHKKDFVMNQVGCTMLIPDQWGPEELRLLSSFVCIGYESAFIHNLMTLHEEYGWINRSIEHDGLVTQGQIPEEAVAKARNLSAFYEAYMEEEWYDGSV
jgi:hypothetical protein